MENNKHHIEEEEINNPEQFQIGRANSSKKENDNQDENSYTPQESEFADGKGTQLDDELGEDAAEQEALNEDDEEQE